MSKRNLVIASSAIFIATATALVFVVQKPARTQQESSYLDSPRTTPLGSFQVTLYSNPADGPTSYTVPAGEILGIGDATGIAGPYNDGNDSNLYLAFVGLSTTCNGETAVHYLPLGYGEAPSGLTGRTIGASTAGASSFYIQADPGTVVHVVTGTNMTPTELNLKLTIAGTMNSD